MCAAVHIVIMGCGRVGAALSLQLAPLEHTLAIIDQDPLAFRRLGDNFPGRTVKGVGFDRETLIEAGIEQAGAYAAVSSGDNSNIIAARVARETFGVQRVVARIYDPKRAEVYERLGIPTVATVPWTASRLFKAVLGERATEAWRDPSGAIALVAVAPHEGWIGSPITAFEAGRIAPPRPVGWRSSGSDERVKWLWWTPFTYPFNITGQPAISVPCGLDGAGLPVGLQIVGRRFDDAGVLRLAAAFERARPRTALYPPGFGPA